jgi:2-methylcitrate dehydratase PrpD
MVHAIAIGASFSSGLTECYKSGGEVKRYHAGIAASGGIRAASLAKMGLTGPATILEGPLGIRAFTDSFTPQVLVDKLGDDFVMNHIWIKKYSASGMIHAPMDCVEKIIGAHDIDQDDIDEVVVGSCAHALDVVGSIREPKDIFGLQYSMNFALALQLVKGGNDFSDYTEENMKDPMIANLSKKIRVEKDEYIDSLFPGKIGGKVTMKMKDGRSYSETVEDCRGTPLNPMSKVELENKVRNVARMTVGEAQINRIIEMVNHLEDVKDVRQLADLLRC